LPDRSRRLYRLTGLLGILFILALAYAFSTSRRSIRWRTVAWGMGLQILFAIFVIRLSWGARLLAHAGNFVTRVLHFAYAGSEMVFGPLGSPNSPLGLIFAFQILPIIIFISATFALLYHFGVMQIILRALARLMQWTMEISGAEALDVSASLFMGHTEAPLTIRPLLPTATTSELMCIMTAGMAHVSGAIMGAYILQGIAAKDLLAAVVMTAPGTIVIAKMLVPETGTPSTLGVVDIPDDPAHKDENALAAVARGTLDGGRLAFNVAIMLIAFLSIIALINGGFSFLSDHLSLHHIPFPHSLNQIFGIIFAPIAWLIGIPWHDAPFVGNLLGTRMVLNELVAYTYLGHYRAAIDPRSFTIATFALCGFANISSIGMLIGGIGALAPTRRNDLARLGVRAMLAGTAANLMSAAIVGILLP
jgi:CNT family concentrative nucleoside transporter